MTKSEDFQVSFHGNAVEDGSMDAHSLAISILALGTLVDQASGLVISGGDKGKVRVKSLTPGSFEINFGLDIARNFFDLFSSKEAEAISNAKEIIGLILGVGGGAGIGIFHLIKRLKGRRPARYTEEKDHIELTVDSEKLIISHTLWKLYGNSKARTAASSFVKPLEDEGIDSIGITSENKEAVRIEKHEADYFGPPVEEEDEVENTIEALLSLVSVSFKPNEKWRVTDGSGSPFFVEILDRPFLERVGKREILFGTNDMLKVELRIIQRNEYGVLKVRREIVKVIKHLPAREQGKLDL